VKLIRRNIPVEIIEIIENLFCGCLACIRWGNSWSSELTIEFGVRQGSVLSPFLFAIHVYLRDVAALCRPESKLFIILYADDILSLAPTPTVLPKLLHACKHQLYLIDMAINFKKCLCLTSLRVCQRYDVVCANIHCVSKKHPRRF